MKVNKPMTTNPLLIASDAELFDYAAVRPEHIAPALDELRSRVEVEFAKATSPETPADYESVMEPLDDAVSMLSRAWGVVGHLQSVVDTPELRSAYNEELPKMTDLFIRMSQSDELFAKVKAIKESESFASLSAARRRIIEREIRDFTLAGADLPKEQRAEVKKVAERLSVLSQKFSENLLDATNAWTLHLEDDSRLKGVPKDALSLYKMNAKEKGLSGYLVTLHIPSYLPIMRYAEDRSLREELYRAYSTRAAEFDGAKFDNTPLIKEILVLRQKSAELLGFKCFAEESLATKMAESPEQVVDFLRDLAQKSKPYAEKDMAALRDFAETLGISDMMPWDQAYVSEKLRESRYSYSDQEVKGYFTESTVFSGLFALAEKLFNIEIRKAQASAWHKDVKYFEVYRDGRLIASFYADLYARSGKRSGAWMDGERSRCEKNGEVTTPIAYLVCNFAPGVDEEATLTHDDVTTLFHEFGHTLHHLLTKQGERALAGVNGVEWDAVELPSQFMENFCWEKDVVKTLTRHVETGRQLPDELFEKMLAAKNYEAGLQSVRQVEFGLFDMLIHSEMDPESGNVMDVLDEVRKEVAVAFPPEYNRFPMSFSHIFAGGYAAGYYSYKWAEVLSADCFSAFEEEGVLNPAVGERYLKEILERGSSRDAMDNFVAFRGRKPTVDALLRHTGILPASR